MSGDLPAHTCTTDFFSPYGCAACLAARNAAGFTSWTTPTFAPPQRISDEDIERIAKRVAEILKGTD